MNVTLEINGRDFAPRLSTYSVKQEVTQTRLIRTLGGTEYAKQESRDVISFKLIPLSETDVADDYATLSRLAFKARYLDTTTNTIKYASVRVVSDLEAVFGIQSVNGMRYYKGGEIQLRAVERN